MSQGTRVKLPKGQVIQSTDNEIKLFQIKNGYVKKYMILNDGTHGVQILYGPGDIFPLTVAFKELFDQDLYKGPEAYYYETMSETEMYSIDNDSFVRAVRADTLLYRDLFSEAGRRLHFNIQSLENISLHNSYNRVAHQLVFFARMFGERKISGIRIKIPLTQQDIADMLSITRETVSLSMTQLKERKLIKTRRHITVRDINKLQEEAYS